MSDAYQALDVNAVDPRKDPLSAPAISSTPGKFPRQVGTDYDALLKRQEQIGDQGLDVMRKGMEESAAARRDLTAAQADYTRTARGAAEKFSKGQRETPEFSQPDMTQATNNYMMFAAAMASLAGAFGRYHSTTAFNAFAGAMNGFAQGNLQAFEQNFAKWKAADTAAQRHNEKLSREYEAVMQSAKLTLDQKMTQVQMIAAANQDNMAYQLATQRNFTAMAQLMEKRDEVATHAETAAAKIEAEYAKGQIKLLEIQNKADKAGLNTFEGFMKLNDFVSKNYNSPDPEVQQRVKMSIWMFKMMHQGSMGEVKPGQIEDLLKDPNAAKNPKNRGFFASLFGSDEGEEPPGASATPAPAASAPAGPAAPPVATPTAARPAAPPAAAAVPPAGPTVRGVQPYQPQATPMQFDTMFLNRRDGRDGRSQQTALRLPRGREVEEFRKLPPGTWVVNPSDGRPIQVPQSGDAMAGP